MTMPNDPRPPATLELLGLNELVQIDRWSLERRARALAQPVYLGDRIALCRALGRYKMFVDTGDVGFGAHMLLDGFWESWLTVFMARRLAPGMAVADVGANHGYCSVLMADAVGPEGRVAVVEPNPRITPLLRRNLDINGFAERASLFEMAVGDADGASVWMRVPAHESKNAHIVPTPTGAAADDQLIQAPAARLETLLRDWSRLDFVKIDVEGAEEAVVAGLWPILERDRPQMVLEFNRHRCQAPEALVDRLRGLYGAIHGIDFEGEPLPPTDEDVLALDRREDWLLYLAPL
jgi:FkbM family methyltransferase